MLTVSHFTIVNSERLIDNNHLRAHMDPQTFHMAEIDVFLRTYYRYENTSEVLRGLLRTEYPSVVDKTKAGIRNGAEEFVTRHGVTSIYMDGLESFVFDDTTERHIGAQVKRVGLQCVCDDDIAAYAGEVCKAYRLFVYNESGERFRMQFPGLAAERTR